MADDSRTPTDTTEQDARAVEETAPPRRRRRAGAPTGAPVASSTADSEPHAPLTRVPTQEYAEPPRTEQQTAAPAKAGRRRAGAPAGPPSIPVFSAADPAPPAPATEDDEPVEALPKDTDRQTSVADDLAALARTSGATEARGSRGQDDRRERAQLDFASLLFQAPEPREDEAAAQEPSPSAEPEGEGDRGTSRGRSRRATSAVTAPETPRDDERAEADAEPTTDEERESAAEDERDAEGSESSRRRRRRGGRGRRGRGRSDEDEEQTSRDDEERDAGDDAPAEDESAEDEETTAGDGSEAEGGRRSSRRSRSRGSRSRGRDREDGDAAADTAEDADSSAEDEDAQDEPGEEGGSSSRRRRRRRRSGSGSGDDRPSADDPPNTVVRVRERRDEIKAVKGSTRLEAKKQRRREGRETGRRRSVITEAEFLARRESVKRSMIVREQAQRTQIAVLEDDVLVEHYVAQKSQTSMVGNVYLGKVQNVLPSMEAAFIDIGKGRNAVLYAGEVNWDAAGLEGQPRRIELALKSGDAVLVQVTKDPIGHKGARLTSQVSLPGRYVVFVPGGSMTGISRKLPDAERARLKKILKQVIPEDAGVIVRTAAEGASEEELTHDVERLRDQWARIEKAQKSKSAPVALSQEPDIAIKVVRDVFNEDFTSLIVQGAGAHDAIHGYVQDVAPDLLDRVTRHMGDKDVFAKHRVDEQLLKAMDRKVYLPSGGSLVIDRTEAMTVVDVNTGKFTGSGGSLEETVTRNNLEAAEEIVRQLRLRDTGGIIVIDFIDMVLEANRDLVLRRLVECLGRDRTKHQVAEVTSLGLVQMTRKRVGQGLVETYSTTCEHCNGRGVMIDMDGTHHHEAPESEEPSRSSRRRGGRKGQGASKDSPAVDVAVEDAASEESVHRLEEDSTSRELARATIASIAAATTGHAHPEVTVDGQVISVDQPEAAPEEQDGAARVEPSASDEAGDGARREVTQEDGGTPAGA